MTSKRTRLIFFLSVSILLLLFHSPSSAIANTAQGDHIKPAHWSNERLALSISGAYEGAEKDIWWLTAKETTYKKASDIYVQIMHDWLNGVRTKILRKGAGTRRQIAITFDDGPHTATTPRLLKILKEYDAKATFFVVGMMAEAAPELILREKQEGHLIANHTYHHVNLTKIPKEYIGVELKACEVVVKQITGLKTKFFRPPGGDYNPAVLKIADDLGYTMVLWTDDPGDYAHIDGQLLKERLFSKISPGGIILLHDGLQGTIDVLPKLLSYLKSEGYTFVTVDALLNEK